MRMLVLGAGLQGSACAFDLLQNPDVREVRLADLNVDHLPPFLAPYSGPRLIPTRVDVRSRDAVLALMRQCDAVMSAIPYYFNFPLAELAVEAGVHFCDLGGNTEIVFQQKGLSEKAAAKGVTIIPDCGLAPGMVNVLAQYGISQLDTVSAVRMFVGGLPQQPRAAAQLPDRVLAGGRARLLHDALVGAARRQAASGDARCRSASRWSFGGTGRRARGVPHGGRSLDHAVPVRGQDSRRWSTRRFAIPGTRTSWRRFASSGCCRWSRST